MTRLVVTFACALVLGACTTVEPWERGDLSKPQMTESAGAQRALLDHVYESREAAAGKTSARGGGCGCY